MGNTASSPKKSSKRSSGKSSRDRKRESDEPENVATRAQKVVGESVQNLSQNLHSSIKKLEEDDHPAAQFLDSVCGGYLDPGRGNSRSNSFYSDYDDETISEVDDETTTTTDYRDRRSRRRGRRDEPSVGESVSYGESDIDSEDRRRKKTPSNMTSESYESEESSKKHGVVNQVAEISANSANIKPLASSFAKRCYFTKAGIGKTTQHYEGLTLTGNVVLMLAAAMKLKGCPTICDEDLRRVEQTYPNQFSRLPDELLLSSGWRRISKYCHFSNKPIPDGVPFFHSKQRLHPSGGYYFLLAAAVGMVRPIDVEPLTRDTLVLLETDYPTACDAAPRILIEDPDQWTLVDKFCFFSGGPINTEEDVYYQADFDGNPIFMLAFLSPSLTPEELYKLDQDTGEPGLKTSAAVEEVESVYDLTERDFDDLRLYHLGPCRALPPYVLQPSSWRKVLPPHFLAARQTALLRAQEFERHSGMSAVGHPSQILPHNHMVVPHLHMGAPHMHNMDMRGMDMHNMAMPMQQPQLGPHYGEGPVAAYPQSTTPLQPLPAYNYPSVGNTAPPMAHHPSESMYSNEDAPMDEAPLRPVTTDPPDDEPPSLSKRSNQDGSNSFSTGDPLVTFSSEQQTTSKLIYSSEDNHGESYEDTEFLGSSAAPTNSESRDYYSNDTREGEYYHNPSGSVLSPGDYSTNTGPHPYQFDQPAEPRPPAPAMQQQETQEEETYRYNQTEEVHHDVPAQQNSEKHDESYRYEHSDEVQHQDSSFESSYGGGHTDENQRGRFQLPPPSPSIQAGSDHVSHTSSAMRGAQELLKRNRQKRLEMAARRSDAGGTDVGTPNNPLQVGTNMTGKALHPEKDVISPQSATTWESSSEVTSVVSGTSSAWTDGSTNADRSSRRALILQMAKARMKKNSVTKPVESKPVNESIHEEEEEKKLDSAGEDDVGYDVKMTRTNSLAESGTGTDIDISQDLD